jgi:hypothetical protein
VESLETQQMDHPKPLRLLDSSRSVRIHTSIWVFLIVFATASLDTVESGQVFFLNGSAGVMGSKMSREVAARCICGRHT